MKGAAFKRWTPYLALILVYTVLFFASPTPEDYEGGSSLAAAGVRLFLMGGYTLFLCRLNRREPRHEP